MAMEMVLDRAMDAPQRQENPPQRQEKMEPRATESSSIPSVLQESNKQEGSKTAAAAAATATTAAIKPVVRVPPRMMFGSNPERYLSPTDSLVSPISKGLLWRNHRRPARNLIPPMAPKALESTFVCTNDVQ